MNDSTPILLSAIIGAIISGPLGIIVGYALNEMGARRREKRTTARQRDNVRTLLRLENGYNLGGLLKVWEAVTKPPDVSGRLGYSTEEEVFVRKHRLATQLIQPWAHMMWQSNARLLADALDQEEINRTYSLHQTLDMFDILRAKLKAEFDTDANKRLWAEYGAWRYEATIASQQSNGQIHAFPLAHQMLAFNQPPG